MKLATTLANYNVKPLQRTCIYILSAHCTSKCISIKLNVKYWLYAKFTTF